MACSGGWEIGTYTDYNCAFAACYDEIFGQLYEVRIKTDGVLCRDSDGNYWSEETNNQTHGCC